MRFRKNRVAPASRARITDLPCDCDHRRLHPNNPNIYQIHITTPGADGRCLVTRCPCLSPDGYVIPEEEI